MNIHLPWHHAEGYKSNSQIARVVTEPWATDNLYCPACTNNEIESTKANNKVFDYLCSQCDSRYQLKSSSKKFGRKLLDGAYETMRKAVMHGDAPNFITLQYSREKQEVNNLVLIPDFVITESCIEIRSPLSKKAIRHDYVGCNILLHAIPVDVRIPMITDGKVISRNLVRHVFKKITRFKDIKVSQRGWTLDVLNCVRLLKKENFSLADMYRFEKHLQSQHPSNHHIQAKIRQQLQVLRDMGLLAFDSRGLYRVL